MFSYYYFFFNDWWHTFNIITTVFIPSIDVASLKTLQNCGYGMLPEFMYIHICMYIHTYILRCCLLLPTVNEARMWAAIANTIKCITVYVAWCANFIMIISTCSLFYFFFLCLANGGRGCGVSLGELSAVVQLKINRYACGPNFKHMLTKYLKLVLSWI